MIFCTDYVNNTYEVIKISVRTDLILESRPVNGSEISGCISSDRTLDSVKINKTEIISAAAAQILKKPIGKYYTLQFERFDRLWDSAALKQALVEVLHELIPNDSASVLAVGLGNCDITPDAIGPLTANGIIATRHLSDKLKLSLGLDGMREVSVLIPGVLGKTGMEAAETVKSAAERISPDVIIVIDALAARYPERLCTTVQICDTGICPGSGVNNARKAINAETVGTKVIAIGVPTVIDASTYRTDCGGESKDSEMMVTPKEIDLLIDRACTMISEALNIFLQPSLDEKTVMSLM